MCILMLLSKLLYQGLENHKQVEHNLEDFKGLGEDTLDEANSTAFRFIFEDLLRPDLSI